MRINAIQQKTNFTSQNSEKKRSSFLDKFQNEIKNSEDLTDTLVVPRTIFKGYLGIMTGTTLVTLGGLLSKYQKFSKTLTVSGLLASLYGTYAFVRPYIIKDANGVQKGNLG